MKNMKTKQTFLWAAIALAALVLNLTSCKSNDPANDNSSITQGIVYKDTIPSDLNACLSGKNEDYITNHVYISQEKKGIVSDTIALYYFDSNYPDLSNSNYTWWKSSDKLATNIGYWPVVGCSYQFSPTYTSYYYLLKIFLFGSDDNQLIIDFHYSMNDRCWVSKEHYYISVDSDYTSPTISRKWIQLR